MTSTDVEMRIKLRNEATEQLAKVRQGLIHLSAESRTLKVATSALNTDLLAEAEALNQLRNSVEDVTDRFKLFGDSGTAVSNALEAITDPQRRLAVAQELWNKHGSFGQGLLGQLSEEYNVLNARVVASTGGLLDAGTVVRGATGAYLGAAAAIGGAMVAAMAKAIEKNKELNAQWELTKKAGEDLTVTVGELILGSSGSGGFEGLEKVLNVARDALEYLNEQMDETAQRGPLAEVAVSNLGNAFLAITTGPLFPLIKGIQLLNSALKDNKDNLESAGDSYLRYLRQQAAAELDEEKTKAFEERIKRAEKARLEGLKFSGSTTGLGGGAGFIGETELSAEATKLYTEALKKEREEQHKKLAVQEELIPLLGKERAEKLGLLDVEKKRHQVKTADEGKVLNKAFELEQLAEEVRRKQMLLDLEERLKAIQARQGAQGIGALTASAASRANPAGAGSARAAAGDTGLALGLAQEYSDTVIPLQQQLNAEVDRSTKSVYELGNAFAYTAAQALAAGSSQTEFGVALAQTFGNLIGNIAPAVTQLGVALFATETGNALGLIAAGIALSALAGTLAGFKGGRGNGGRGGSSLPDNTSKLRQIGQEFERSRQRDEQLQPINVIIGGEQVAGPFTRTIREAFRRGHLTVPRPAGFL